ncbi:MAG: hypothetical protein CND43_01655 [Flavobacteriales bacterium MED-G15]|nr:MAG: hypothetical protein CND43_01655 [Flavobacteriales bacterium MED-G15]|tara:strand:+ start:3441 stop:3665 length:225 start_codon:yes stop_codon:yes gene_type:complete
MQDILVVLVFLAVLFGGVYWYAGYSIRSGFAKDENQNFIPDAWEDKFNWFFSSKVLIMFFLGIAIGYTIAKVIG